MRSSTSSSDASGSSGASGSGASSDAAVFARAVPRGRWATACAVAAAITLALLAAWEVHVRLEGYAPSMNDTSDRWARVRSEVGTKPGQTVVVGSSRILFDLDLATVADHLDGGRPLELAMPGTNPVGLLEHVARAEGFDGTLILGVTPMLWFVPEGMPVDNARRATGRYDNWSPSQRVGLALAAPLDRRLAFVNPDDLTLGAMLGRLRLPDRPGAARNLPPVLPPFFGEMDAFRQVRMWKRCDFGTELAARIQQIWIPLFTPPPPPPHLSAEEFGQMMQANVAATLERIRVAVETVQARGARVVFVRLPSSGTLREMERQYGPRAALWDRMLEVTGAPGIHFEDHPELAAFECPEWSHLTARDAVRFTEALMPLVVEALAGGEGQAGRAGRSRS